MNLTFNNYFNFYKFVFKKKYICTVIILIKNNICIKINIVILNNLNVWFLAIWSEIG